MKKEPIRVEHCLYGLAFLIALIIRFWHLGVLPLSDSEASLALRALNLANGFPESLSAEALYGLVTGALMALFSGSNLIARFLPAFIGSLLIIAPAMYRNTLGKTTAIILAFWLAFEPGLVAISREANSTILAISFAVLTGGFYVLRKPTWAGVGLALFLLSGPDVWHGLILFGLIAAFRFAFLAGLDKHSELPQQLEELKPPFNWRKVWIMAALTIIVIGTLLFTIPKGISAAALSLPVYISGWAVVPQFNVSIGLLGLGLTALPGLILAIWQFIVGWNKHHQLDKLLGVSWAFAVILAVFYPGRTMAHFAWSLLPMAALASRRLDGLRRKFGHVNPPDLIQAITTIAGGIFLWLSLLNLSLQPINLADDIARLKLAVFVVGLILWLLITILISWGWDARAAVRGNQLGLGVLLSMFLIATSWRASGNGTHPDAEIWRTTSPQNEPVLLALVESAGEWTTGNNHSLPLTVVVDSSLSLKWALRDQNAVQYALGVNADSQQVAILTDLDAEPILKSSYRGEDIIWLSEPDWQAMTGRDWLRWVAFRDVPLKVTQTYIFWLRSDAFPQPGGFKD